MSDTIICPICNGTGKFHKSYRVLHDRTMERLIARKLKKAGYSVREIMKSLGYKHPGSIQYLLTSKSKK